jgi:PAS domain-containing protein
MDHLPPDIAEKTSYYINKALSENKIQYYTYQLEVPGSGLHYYEARMIPSGEQEVTAIVRDVTEREETIKRLIESEARSTALLNAIPDLMFRLSKDGVYLDYSADCE